MQGSAEEGKSLDAAQMAAVYDNRALLQSLSRYIVREETNIPEEVALSILKVPCQLVKRAKVDNKFQLNKCLLSFELRVKLQDLLWVDP